MTDWKGRQIFVNLAVRDPGRHHREVFRMDPKAAQQGGDER